MSSRLAIAAALFGVLASTTPAAAIDYDIDFKVTNAKAYGVVQFKAHYTNAPGEFSGNGASVSCTPNSSINSLAAFNEKSPYLKAGFIATTEFAGPVVLATCVFSSTAGAPTAGQFSITIDDWQASTHSTPPTVAISRIALH